MCGSVCECIWFVTHDNYLMVVCLYLCLCDVYNECDVNVASVVYVMYV